MATALSQHSATQRAIPYVFMRGGTSRGPYFLRDQLPQSQDALAQALIAVIGAGHPLNIDGIGGGAAVTTKVAMLCKSEDTWADVDYFFAQVAVEERRVDFKPTCGNILAGVGPAAIELGLITPTDNTTEVKIRAINTGAQILARLYTPGHQISYEGDQAIAGVPGTAAPVALHFLKTVGSVTGTMLPTGNARDVLQGIEVTCMDVAIPVVIAQAEALGITGYESAQALDANQDLFARMEAIRIAAGAKMGMGDVSQSVIPKFGLLSKAQRTGNIAARYFMPWKTHPSMAVTGAQCLAACALLPRSVADGLLQRPSMGPAKISIEHPCGEIEVLIDYSPSPEFVVYSAGLVRTARKLADGHVYIPATTF